MSDDDAIEKILDKVAPDLYAAGVRVVTLTMACTGNPTISVSVGTEADVSEFLKKEETK